MKCQLCKNFKARGKADLDHHIEAFHKLTPEGYRLAVNTLRAPLAGLSAMQRAMKIVFLVSLMAVGVGCRGVERLIGGSTEDEGTPYIPPHGPLAEQNVVPVYDQVTATQPEDELLVQRVIGDPSAPGFQAYVSSPWLVDRLNGIHNLMLNPAIGYNSVTVDSWKALARLGYIDNSKLTNVANLRQNSYPVPVYQGDKAVWGY